MDSTPPKILTAMPLRASMRDRLAGRYEIVGPLERAPVPAVPPEARDARALITLGSFRTGPELLDALPQLGLVVCYGTGFEGVDLAAAAVRGIAVANAGDTNATGVAEFAMALVLATARHVLRSDRMIREGRWVVRGGDTIPLAPGLAGRRIGIYGLGSIGLKVAQRASAFEMTVGYHNRRPRDVPYEYHPTLLGLAAWCDVLVVAVRAGADNREAVNAAVLRALGPEGVLVNIARGIAVDEAALCDALEAGTIAGAGLDVFQDEPRVPERLKALGNVVLTPHMAALTSSTQALQQQRLVDNLDAFFAGRPLPSAVPLPG